MRKAIPLLGYTEGHGGRLRSRRNGRGARPLSRKGSLHLILKSSQATGTWSFRRHKAMVYATATKFAAKHGLQILGIANAGNHIHFHLRSPSRIAYKKFIRALTSAIAISIAKISRWGAPLAKKFWDFRPFSRVVEGAKATERVEDYVVMNRLEMAGFPRANARKILEISRAGGGIFYGESFRKRRPG